MFSFTRIHARLRVLLATLSDCLHADVCQLLNRIVISTKELLALPQPFAMDLKVGLNELLNRIVISANELLALPQPCAMDLKVF